MTKDQDESPRKKRKVASTLVWGLMALCMVGLGGFGVTNFGGGMTTIASVGDRKITAQDYARALQQELNALSQQFGQTLTLAQATQMGIDQQVLQRLIAQAALDNEADRLGVSVGDVTVAQRITEMPVFVGSSGSFDRATYRDTLGRNNLTESSFESQLRGDIARQLLTGSVASGFAANTALVDTLYNFIGERRGFSVLRLTPEALQAALPQADEAALKAYYDANIASFTKPEAKRIQYAALLPATLAAKQEVSEDALRKLYQDRISEYVQPEKRLVERLVFADDASAQAALDKVKAGTSTFEDLVKERGLELDDADMGDVAQAELGAAGEAVFALTEPGVVGPFASPLGPALFRMNGILTAQEVSFDEAKTDLAVELQQEEARRDIADKVHGIDDALAGGDDLANIAKDMGASVESIDYVGAAQSNVGIAGYPAFRQAAGQAQEGDFPEAVLLDDGGVVVMQMLQNVPAAPIPFEEARPQVLEAWKAAEEAKLLAARGEEVKAALAAGQSLDSFGQVSRVDAIAREGNFEGAPNSFVPALFDMAQGDVTVFTDPGFTAVVVLDKITPAASEGEDAKALKEAIAAQVEQGTAQDALQLYTMSLTSQAGISIDQTAITAVHTQFN